MTPAPILPPEVLDAIRRGDLIGAIRMLSRSRGVGLAEAKALVAAVSRAPSSPGATVQDRNAAGTHATGVQADSAWRARGSLPATVMQALGEGNKLEAIRLLRESTGVGLKEAKDTVDAAQAAAEARHGPLSPGEVPRHGAAWWWVAGIAAMAMYGFWRSVAG